MDTSSSLFDAVGALIRDLHTQPPDEAELRNTVCKYGVKPAVIPRIPVVTPVVTPADPHPATAALQCDVLPIQLHSCISHVRARLRPRRDDIFRMTSVGDASDSFIYFCELLRPHYQKCEFKLIASTPLTLPLLAYSARCFFDFTFISLTNESFIQTCNKLQADLIVLNVTNDDINILLTCTDLFLSRGCALVVFNIADPAYPNTSKMWKMCLENPKLSCTSFTHTYENTGLSGGGLGYVSIV